MSLSPAADRFRRTAAGFLARVEAVPAGRWSAPTPCPGWTARDVVAHVVNEQRRMLAAVTRTEPLPLHGVDVAEIGAIPAVAPDADLAAAWREIGDGLTAAIDDPDCADVPLPMPMGEQPFATIVELRPEDPLIHTWDLARATNLDERLEPDVVAHVFELLKPLDQLFRQPWAFGPRTPPPAGTDLQTEFLCFVGRRP
ncbi:TIGR03086 family protein [Amycolatopsis arida]|uniref:TIGR03086 family protein n=1 Tax=Amycolatopsis arida TaxID=587909 RepID=A0A1I5LB16_9PSEU|nr:TIGR03086 family metal-binding protein [Amycolatopsis arida]TDX93652.1 uncharacterized protein (TIGR03086 family) [Amycolatopsis arida]SFO94352.1 TIGR03086 family protein [Amycolatopsis arida]